MELARLASLDLLCGVRECGGPVEADVVCFVGEGVCQGVVAALACVDVV
jgi:hypothetical protein